MKHGESWTKERFILLLFCLFESESWPRKKRNQFGESSPSFIFAAVNLDPLVKEKRWSDGESWPNDFVEEVNRGEDLRWVSSRCTLTRALSLSLTICRTCVWNIILILNFACLQSWQSFHLSQGIQQEHLTNSNKLLALAFMRVKLLL